jgi:hypothetical protein
VGYACLKLGPDPTHHPVEVIAHIRVAEPDRPEAFSQKNRIPGPVMLATDFMHAPVHLHDEASPEACEI